MGTAAYVDLTLKGLTSDRQYQIQVFASDDRSDYGQRTMHFSDASTTGVGNETPVFAEYSHSYAIGTFTASGSTEDVYGRSATWAMVEVPWPPL